MNNEFLEFQYECADCGALIDPTQCDDHECREPQELRMLQDSNPTIPDADNAEANDIVPKLVEAVQARPALWDHTLPLKNRGKDIKEKLWREVHKEINGALPLEQLDKKWRNLRDTFLKYSKKYTPSGSGRDEKTKKWKYFDLLNFLAEKNAPRQTYSNIPEEAIIAPLSSTPSCSSWSSVDRTPSLKRKKTSDKHDDLLQQLLQEQPPAPPAPPAISPALLTVQSILEKLPVRVRMQAEIDILNKVYALHAEHCSE